MAQEVVSNAEWRLVRDEDAGAYLLQVGADGAFRTFSQMKLGKLDQLRAAARAESASTSQTQQSQ